MKYILLSLFVVGLQGCQNLKNPKEVPDYNESRPGLFTGEKGKFELTRPTVADEKPAEPSKETVKEDKKPS
ncbi:MAG TPA: hypothetical protein VI959_04725 [Alphaproteobacteria bacterium]|nr:hypothetical protein [Alphaproteobacteria bacterium]